MAIQKTVLTEYGFTQLDAYIKVSRYMGDKEEITLMVDIFVSQDTRNSRSQPLETKVYTMPYVDGMSISSLYNHLKTLPEFAGAVDV